MPMIAFRDRNRHSPVHDPADGVRYLSREALARITEQEVHGGENAVRQPCAIAEHEEQRDQRNQEEK